MCARRAGVSGPYHYSERDAKASSAAADDQDRVWPLDSLDLINKFGSPAWVAISGSFSNPSRYSLSSGLVWRKAQVF